MTVLSLSPQDKDQLMPEKELQFGHLNGRSVRQIPSNERLTGADRHMFDGLFDVVVGIFAAMVGSIVFFASAYATGSLATAAAITGGTAILFLAVVGAQTFNRN